MRFARERAKKSRPFLPTATTDELVLWLQRKCAGRAIEIARQTPAEPTIWADDNEYDALQRPLGEQRVNGLIPGVDDGRRQVGEDTAHALDVGLRGRRPRLCPAHLRGGNQLHRVRRLLNACDCADPPLNGSRVRHTVSLLEEAGALEFLRCGGQGSLESHPKDHLDVVIASVISG